MDFHIGSKALNAEVMTLGEYNDFRGWELPKDEDGSTPGYLVEYLDGGKANVDTHEGYISWSPKDVFEHSYRKSDNFTFGDALELMGHGAKLARTGWNGKGMCIFLVQGYNPTITPDSQYAMVGVPNVDGTVIINPTIHMVTATGEVQPGWLASQADMLAKDWMLVE